MVRKTRLLKLGLTVMLCVLSLCIVINTSTRGMAVASPSSSGGISLKKATTSHIVSAPQNDAAKTYWTPARLKSARDIDVLTGNFGKVSAALPAVRPGTPKSIAPVPPQHFSRPASGAATSSMKITPNDYSYPFPYVRYEVGADYTQWPYSTEGKVFFTDSTTGGNFVCSGTAVVSNNKSVVDTAGHCVVQGGSGSNWYTNWIFCPAYKDGNCQLGEWTARQLFSDTYWSSNNWVEYDFGAAVINPDGNGTALTDAIGSEGIAWNYPRNQYFSALGYPQAAPFDGNRLIECDAPYATDLSYGTGLPLMGIGCDMTGGSSGGPWYFSFGSSGGYRNGHNDWKLGSQPLAIYSPYYGDDWHNLVYNPAQNA